MALSEVITALQIFAVFGIGVVATLAVAEDKENQGAARSGTTLGIILICAGAVLYFRVELAGLAIGLIGSAVLAGAAIGGIKEEYSWKYGKWANLLSDSIATLMGMAYVLASMAAILLSIYYVLGFLLAIMGLLLISTGFSRKEKSAVLYESGIVLLLLAAVPLFL